MEDNWYEATVSASLPHRIISVVDWASDSPMPLYSPESHSHEAQLPPLSSFLASCDSSKKVGGRFRKGKAVADLRKIKAAKAKEPLLKAFAPLTGSALPDIPEAKYNVFPWGTN